MTRLLSRRHVLSMLGVSSAALASTLSQVRAQQTPGVLDVAIIGAGAAGLTAGWLLDQAKANVRLFEADGVIGGRARKNTGFADFPLDLGGEWIHTTNEVLTTLSGSPRAADRAVEYRPMTSDVISGGQIYRDNDYAREWRGEHRFVSTTWFDFFNDFMAPSIRDRIFLNAQVTEVDHSGETVRLRLANGGQVRAHHVIVTVPLNVLKDGDIRFTPDLPRSKKRAMRGATMPDGFKLFMKFSRQFYPDLILFDHAYDTPEAEIIFYNVSLDKPTRQNILGFFGHGVVATPYTRMTERDHVQAALDLLDKHYKGQASAAFQGHLLQNWSKAPFHRGTYSNFHGGRPAVLGRSIDGRVHFAGEAYNRNIDGEWGYMHVAARTGYDAVAEIAR